MAESTETRCLFNIVLCIQINQPTRYINPSDLLLVV